MERRPPAAGDVQGETEFGPFQFGPVFVPNLAQRNLVQPKSWGLDFRLSSVSVFKCLGV